MNGRVKSFGLVLVGAIAGILVSHQASTSPWLGRSAYVASILAGIVVVVGFVSRVKLTPLVVKVVDAFPIIWPDVAELKVTWN